MSIDYYTYIQSREWKCKADQRREIDYHYCRFCEAEGFLHVHHRTYKRLGHERMTDLITLCPCCHHGLHANERRYKSLALASGFDLENFEFILRQNEIYPLEPGHFEQWNEYSRGKEILWELVDTPRAYDSGIQFLGDYLMLGTSSIEGILFNKGLLYDY